MWIRIETTVGHNDKVLQARTVLGLSTAEMVGHLVMLWGQIAEHRPFGNVGDLHPLVLEEWAKWTGEPGQFGDTFKELFASSGVVDGWDEYQGKLIERQIADRDRKRQQRRNGKSTDSPRTIVRRSSATGTEGSSTPLRDDSSTPPVAPRANVPPTREAIAEALAPVPNGADVVFRFVDGRPPKQTEAYWLGMIAGWLTGQNAPGNQPVPPAVIVSALSDYTVEQGRDYGPRHVRKFLETAVAEHAGPRSPPNGTNGKQHRGGGVAARTFRNAQDAFRDET